MPKELVSYQERTYPVKKQKVQKFTEVKEKGRYRTSGGCVFYHH